MTRRTRTVVLAAALAAACLGTAVPASAAIPASVSWHHGLPAHLVGRAASLHPEGVTWDPTRQAFLVSSARHGTVSVVRRDGGTRVLVDDPAIISSYGVHVDAARGRILVAYADLGVATRSTAETTLKVGGVGVFDLATGRRLFVVDLTRLEPTRAAFAVNDLTFGPDGTIYAADVFSDAVYRITPRGQASVLVRDPALTDGNGVGVNGIVYHPSGNLLGVNTGDGRLIRISLRTKKVSTVVTPGRLVGGDGLAVRRDGTVVAVTNSLGSPNGTDAVRVLASADGWRTAREQWTNPAWPVRGPSTVAVTPHGDYVLSGRLELLFGPDHTTADDFVLRRATP
ncbi:hypothetical protein [Actinokineospora diospyrosa]|uniref:hypothetical protein n=1 Tax=Actinokineospora diospyrosa TaxID=103728 RepID=UPI0020A2CE50|nr:hypothetical protein [Actinokineospora diospyrosa]